MNRMLAWMFAVLVIVTATWYLLSRSQGGAAALAPDLYPLYSGVEWSEPTATSSPEYGQVALVRATAATGTMNIAAAAMPFERYYRDKLAAAGWTQDIMREASGPGANVSVYTKGDRFIVVMFRSVFHVRPEDAPVQCPCDVEFTLMSGMQAGPTPAEQLEARTYRDSALGFSIVLPTEIASAPDIGKFYVDPAYEYTAFGPGKSIPGVKFTIPILDTEGNNLSNDTYLSVEHLPAGAACDAAAFLDGPVKSQLVQEGAVRYSVASTTGAAVGNRYDEWVYARVGSDPCIAVRYFIHYAAIENFPPDTVQDFGEAQLVREFDDIRRTLRLGEN